MTSGRLIDLASGRLAPASTAFFLDCDGTLSQIVARPEMARVSGEIIICLKALSRATNGAVAVVSGRSIPQLDVMLAPLVLPLAGVHGVERRDAKGRIFQPPSPTELLDRLATELQAFEQAFPGVVCERKTASIALHYRMRPELEEKVLTRMADLTLGNPQLRLLRGKMVVELNTSDRNKGDAIRDFMREEPFKDRMPVFVGDDVTDEDGFEAVTEFGGLGIKIGQGATRAGERFDSIHAFHAWLNALAGAWSVVASKEGGEDPATVSP